MRRGEGQNLRFLLDSMAPLNGFEGFLKGFESLLMVSKVFGFKMVNNWMYLFDLVSKCVLNQTGTFFWGDEPRRTILLQSFSKANIGYRYLGVLTNS